MTDTLIGCPETPGERDKAIERVRKLRAKAASTTFAPERDALNAKASELMMRHSVTYYDLDGVPPEPPAPPAPVVFFTCPFVHVVIRGAGWTTTNGGPSVTTATNTTFSYGGVWANR